MRIDDEERRIFYQEECVKSRWSVRQLERQINTLYYDRILASKDKEKVADEIDKYMEQLALWRDALRSDDGEKLKELMRKAGARRRELFNEENSCCTRRSCL